jgi:hypothetical protein
VKYSTHADAIILNRSESPSGSQAQIVLVIFRGIAEDWRRFANFSCPVRANHASFGAHLGLLLADHPPGISLSLQVEHKQFIGNGNSLAPRLGEPYFFALICNRAGRRIF